METTIFTLNCKERLLVINSPVVMGVINATPDSFYDESRKPNVDTALRQAEQMLKEGAAILDIGGQSTRPGSNEIGHEEELKRVLPIVESIQRHFPDAFISIDTYHSKVAREAVASGACIVNDISSGAFDEAMLETVASLHVPYIAMHMKGTPATMQQHAVYDDVAREVLDFFIKKVEQCRLAGIHDVVVDPGFGFAKTIKQNFELLKKMEVLKMPGKPLMAGISRKSTVYKTLNVLPAEALNGTTVLNTIALLNGANILRVHDVKEAKEAITLFENYRLA